MSFKDIFKKSFLEGFTAMDISTSKILATLAMVVILSLYIFCIYQVVTRKTFYSKTFNISLAAIAIITASIILAMQSNLVISLGMVGALSIVRFRTAIKDPMDLIFLFWSISIGIICGGGLYEDAVMEAVKKYSHLCRVKSRNISNGREDMILELRVKEEKKLVEEVSAVSGVEYVSLLAHDGEVTF